MFIIFAVADVIEQRHRRAVYLCVAASYLDVLVGGWFFLALICYLLIFRLESIHRLGRYIGYFLIWTSVQIVYLAHGMFMSSISASIDGVNTDWIYSNLRNPHHAGIFVSKEFFLETHAMGVGFCLVWVIVSGVLSRRKNQHIAAWRIAVQHGDSLHRIVLRCNGIL